MNKIVSIILSCSAAFMFGCSTTENKQIVGQWKSSGEAEVISEFRQDGTFTFTTENVYEVGGNWTILDDGRMQVDYLIPGKEIAPLIFEFSIDRDTLTTTGPEGEVHNLTRIK